MSDAKSQDYDLENWMGDLPQIARSFPIVYLAIPGFVVFRIEEDIIKNQILINRFP